MIILIAIVRAQIVMGTILEIEAYGKDAEVFVDSVFSLALRMDSLWRFFWEGWISKGETLNVDPLTDSLLVLSLLYMERTDGLFNPVPLLIPEVWQRALILMFLRLYPKVSILIGS